MRKPDFIIIGAGRCGTTRIKNALRKVPDIWMPNGEQYYFTHFIGRFNQSQRRKKYYAQFANRGGCVTGEKTPRYLYHLGALWFIKREVPNAKLVVLLRDPYRRYLSHHGMYNAYNKKTYGKKPIVLREFLRTDDGMQAASYGDYATYLRGVLRLFPSSQVDVEFNEDVRRRPGEVAERLLQFVGSKNREWSICPSKETRSSVPGWLIDELRPVYEQSKQELPGILGREVPGSWI